jgi:hypothetical protein
MLGDDEDVDWDDADDWNEDRDLFEDDEDEDWEEQEIKIMNEERIAKLQPLVTAQEAILAQVKETNTAITELNAKKAAIEKQRIANIGEINKILVDNETFSGAAFSYTRLAGVLYTTALVK